jgi:hypothetical protein
MQRFLVATAILQLVRECLLAPHFKHRILSALVYADSSSSSALASLRSGVSKPSVNQP